ncbi:hypothetical protein PR048_030634 [Dryococelus australis]|uniref:Uncharacterized protein n=1 Tax=Dryococelus australis TaxID=614101 RepID=A0ABQ9G9Y5_9NEOP|nr:hypothetical protein PR048_030634 [Dryococelus australis]
MKVKRGEYGASAVGAGPVSVLITHAQHPASISPSRSVLEVFRWRTEPATFHARPEEKFVYSLPTTRDGEQVVKVENSLVVNGHIYRGDERLTCSPPTTTKPGSLPGWFTPDFHKWESCRTMPLVGGFSRGSSVSPAPSF